jgi:hypothetical protein
MVHRLLSLDLETMVALAIRTVVVVVVQAVPAVTVPASSGSLEAPESYSMARIMPVEEVPATAAPEAVVWVATAHISAQVAML